jgi:hypothetical protein
MTRYVVRGNRANRQSANQADQQDDCQISTPPAPERRAEAIPGDGEGLAHVTYEDPLLIDRRSLMNIIDIGGWNCEVGSPTC